MATYPVVRLRQGKEAAPERFHPWVFSGAVASVAAGLEPGALVCVQAHSGKKLGTAFFEDGSITLKMISFDSSEQVDSVFWKRRILDAWHLREQLGLTESAQTNMFRLVHSEGDRLPGLIVDVYGHTAVMQAHTAGMAALTDEITAALMELPGDRIKAVYNKSDLVLSKTVAANKADGYLAGEKIEDHCLEHGLKYSVDWEKGQKTGFFIDQRENRHLLGTLSKGKRVLNTFSYSGGFSVSAMHGGASHVVSVDSSKQAIALCDQNIALNGFTDGRHESFVVDAKKYLVDMEDNSFDIIVLDPPAFAKNQHNRSKGLEGYRYINYLALKKLSENGLLFTFSCSQAVDHASFRGAVQSAAIEARRNIRIVQQPVQPPDHPVNIFHPEGFYLKGLVLAVD